MRLHIFKLNGYVDIPIFNNPLTFLVSYVTFQKPTRKRKFYIINYFKITKQSTHLINFYSFNFHITEWQN